ncbi:TolB family protein [Kribbella sp. NPDC048928]|uniref:TolB family protein n=1 Tax=Kribbella sp. NPDC048928 TaxID=3364111 RepID=UPI003714DA18
MTGPSRRSLLIGGAGAALVGAFGTLDGLPALAGPPDVRPRRGGPLSTDVQWITGYDTTAYVTYMHQNGYFHGCRYFVYRKALTLGGPNLLHVYDTVMQTSFQVPDRAGHQMVGGYLDVSRATGLLLNAESPSAAKPETTRPRIWAYDLNEHVATGSSTWEQIYQVPEGATIADTTASINAAGTHIALSELYGKPAVPEIPGDQISKIVKVDIATGVREVLVERETLHNHVHFCPYDEDWIVFSREGDSTLHKERVWAHHPVHAPAGANVVPQILASGQVLRLSHERASWDAPTVVVINYENPRGVWRGFLDGSEPEQLATGRFEHCDVSRDGRYVVTDTSLTGSAMCIQVIDTTGQFPITTVVPQTNRGVSHPRHNHPIFSPDGRYVLFNDPDPDNVNTGGLRIGIVDLRAFGYPV